MPLEFQSLSHGPIAFGFFNIETDLVLLEHYFLFATDFCDYICQLAKAENESQENIWSVYSIERRADIGDLMGAIHGIRYLGFIGDVYRRFPFPLQSEDFKQKPEGYQTRSTVEELIQHYARMVTIPVVGEQSQKTASIGEYVFSIDWFQELLQYVWRGGYPRWKDEVRPHYVLEMKNAIVQSRSFLFAGLVFPSHQLNE